MTYKVIERSTGDIIYVGKIKNPSTISNLDKYVIRVLRRKDPSISILTHHIEWISSYPTKWSWSELKRTIRDNGHSLRLMSNKSPQTYSEKLETIKEWNKNNPEKVKQYSKNRKPQVITDEQRERRKEYAKNYYIQNKDYYKHYEDKNRGKINQYQKEYYKKKRKYSSYKKIMNQLMNEDKDMNPEIPRILNRQTSDSDIELFNYDELVKDISDKKMRKQVMNFLYYSDNVIKEYSHLDPEERLKITSFLSHMRSWIRNEHMDKPKDLKIFDKI